MQLQQQSADTHAGVTKQLHQSPPAALYDMSTSDSDSDSGPLRVPLKLVVQDAVKRWFNETLSEVSSDRVGGPSSHPAVLACTSAHVPCRPDRETKSVDDV